MNYKLVVVLCAALVAVPGCGKKNDTNKKAKPAKTKKMHEHKRTHDKKEHTEKKHHMHEHKRHEGKPHEHKHMKHTKEMVEEGPMPSKY